MCMYTVLLNIRLEAEFKNVYKLVMFPNKFLALHMSVVVGL